jgi:hypothetical protein
MRGEQVISSSVRSNLGQRYDLGWIIELMGEFTQLMGDPRVYSTRSEGDTE